MNTDANYPLDSEWISNPDICPEIVGFRDDFEGGLKRIIDNLKNFGFAHFSYQSLTQFGIFLWNTETIWSPIVAINVKGRDWHTHTINLARIRTEDVADKFNLLEDDAKVITYLLRQVGRRLQTEELVSDD